MPSPWPWQQGEHSNALSHYDSALDMLRASGDTEKEGMVCMGKGCLLTARMVRAFYRFALVNIGKFKEAVVLLERAQQVHAPSGCVILHLPDRKGFRE